MTGEEAAQLRETVQAQAEAFIAGDLAAFASYALPQAVSPMYRARVAKRARSFEILRVEDEAGQGTSEVRFPGTPGFVMRGSWLLTEAGWKASVLEVPEESAREGLLRRLVRFGRPARQLPQREDLS